MQFFQNDLNDQTLWRAIILFGQNVASYKFALGKSLLELAGDGKSFVSMEELAVPFSHHVCQHMAFGVKQATSKSSKFLDVCAQYNRKEITHEQLVDTTVRQAFGDVIDRFHIVNRGEIPTRFYMDERPERKGIVLTDALGALVESQQIGDLPHEVEARWRLVETAWSLNVAPRLLEVSYADAEDRFVYDDGARRIDITSSRPSLNGYQKGACFYCGVAISLDSESSAFCDVDHFFPHTLKQSNDVGFANIDGVWNLVLSCQDCNRGVGGKHALLPSLRLLSKLHRRNEYYIESHHPLRETIVNQTGKMPTQRRDFLQSVYNNSRQLLVHEWDPARGADDQI